MIMQAGFPGNEIQILLGCLRILRQAHINTASTQPKLQKLESLPHRCDNNTAEVLLRDHFRKATISSYK